ncbi:hypothetical protein J2X08_002461 [Rhizobium rosettiformans]|nr:hypothetical protein [Rhizobium rosettiformans]MDR7064963.1 hypothetical protein [Rhizobium rosettiformans]
MSGGRARTALEETGMRLGDLLRRALRKRLARRPEQGGSAENDLPSVERDHTGRGDAASGQAISDR